MPHDHEQISDSDIIQGTSRASLLLLLLFSDCVDLYHCNCSLMVHLNNTIIISPSERVTTPEDTLHHNNRISVSLQKTPVSAADSGYYTRFSQPDTYLCGDKQGKQSLPSTLQKYFNFIASIQTDLKIIFVGDSISAQFAQAFDSAALDEAQEDSVRAKNIFRPDGNRPSIIHICRSICSPIRGGGVSAFWRITNLILKKNNKWPSRCTGFFRHWNEGQALDFLNHEYNSTQFVLPSNKGVSHQVNRTTTDYFQKSKLASFKAGNVNVVKGFDAAVFRVPHGWLQLDYIDSARLIETIETTHRILGATTIVIPTLPMSNNVKSENDWKKVTQINRMIRQVARNITKSEGDVQYVLVQEFGNLTNQLLMENAKNLDLLSLHQRDIDYSREGWEVDVANVFLQRPPITTKKWPPSYSQVCSSLPSNRTEACPGVKISSDGMHWCVETFGGRFTASIACLLGCVYNVARPPTDEEIRKCEQRCNDQFMSLNVVRDEMFKN